MSVNTELVDARGLACPEPVIRTKRALEAGSGGAIEVLVDNPAARENVLRFAAYAGRKARAVEEGGDVWRILVEGSEVPSSTVPALPEAAKGDSGAGIPSSTIATLLIASATLGQGAEELGALLMKGFLYALAEATERPRRIIFMNGGVLLCAESSPSLADLRRLEAAGVEILACGTCLDYYRIKESLAVGRVTNMYEIASCILQGNTTRL